ncbi:GmrSD restriction endonuclease domain-containing protein [Lacticaseibacillus paracasei]|nr:DUF262 domain-containing protein [Lacticaseibacillus paracasei]
MIRISERLSPSAALNPTKTSQTKSVFDMCEDIENNKISLPLYQRDLSWPIKKAIALFNYQLFGRAPVAPISMNQIEEHNEIPQISFLDRQRLDNDSVIGNLSIVDGQQRLATNFRAYMNDPEFEHIVLDVTVPIFKEIKTAPRSNQIPVGILLNKSSSALKNYLQQQGTLTDLYPTLLEVRNKLSNYNYTVHIARNLNEDQQIEWFDVLNTAGSRVTDIQLTFSKIKLHDFDIYTEYVEPFKDKLSDYGLSELMSPFTTRVSYPIVSLNPSYEVQINKSSHKLNYAPIPSDAKKTALSKLNRDQLSDMSTKTLESLDYALKLIYDNHLTNYVTRIDYVLYLTGYFVFNNYPPTDEISQSLQDWIKNVKFENQSNKERREIYNRLLALY